LDPVRRLRWFKEVRFGMFVTWGLCWEGKVKQATLLTTGKPVRVEQAGSRLFLRGLPVANPDRVAQVPVIKLECATRPRMPMDWSYEDPEGARHRVAAGKCRSNECK